MPHLPCPKMYQAERAVPKAARGFSRIGWCVRDPGTVCSVSTYGAGVAMAGSIPGGAQTAVPERSMKPLAGVPGAA